MAENIGHLQNTVTMVSLLVYGLRTAAQNQMESPTDSRNITLGSGKNEKIAGTESTRTCRTEACQRAAQEFLASIDPVVDPCEDFFAYSCNNWIKSHPFPPDRSIMSESSVLNELIKEQLRGVLNGTMESDELKAKQIAKEFFRRCMDEDKLAAEGFASFDAAISATLTHWPAVTPNWIPNVDDSFSAQLIRLSKHYAVHPLLSVSFGNRLEKVSETAIYLQVVEGFGKDIVEDSEMRLLYLNATSDLLNGMIGTLIKASDHSQLMSKMAIESDAAGIVDWMTFLSNISLPSVQQRDPYFVCKQLTIGELKSGYFSKSSTAKNLTNVLQEIIANQNSSFLVNDSLMIYVANIESFRQLDDKLFKAETSPILRRSLLNFFGYTLLSSYYFALPGNIREFFEKYQRRIIGTSEQEPRWKDCVDHTKTMFPMATGALYVENVPKDTRGIVRQMVHDIKEVYREIIKSSTWMNLTTRNGAIAKLDNLLEYEIFPDYFLDSAKVEQYHKDLQLESSFLELAASQSKLTFARNARKLQYPPSRQDVLEDPDGMNTADVNAYYQPSVNGLAILAGISQFPFFDAALPDYINYAGLGSIVGHEIGHGFDDEGSKFDKDGNLRNWWTDGDRMEYDRKAAGIVKQYDGYQLESGSHVNGNLTQGENIADNGGFHASRLAYQKRIKGKREPEMWLPGMEHLTIDQLYFIAYAHSWCGHVRPELEKTWLLLDPHSPDKFRINGVVSNSVEFATVFNCTKGRMIANDKQGIW